MRVLFDTSVIVAALLPKHPSHIQCFAQLRAAELAQIQGYLSTHSLAEIYSVITRMPSQPRVSPHEAQMLIDGCLQYLEAVSLEIADYQAAIACMIRINLAGGGVFDALIAQAALKVSVDQLLTLNPSHFSRLNSAIAQITTVPE